MIFTSPSTQKDKFLVVLHNDGSIQKLWNRRVWYYSILDLAEMELIFPIVTLTELRFALVVRKVLVTHQRFVWAEVQHHPWRPVGLGDPNWPKAYSYHMTSAQATKAKRKDGCRHLLFSLSFGATTMCIEVLPLTKWLDITRWWDRQNKSSIFPCFHM